MNITVVTTWLPTTVAPSSGSFVLRDCTAIRDAGVGVRIVHLVPPHQDDGTRHVMMNGMQVLRIPFTPANPLSLMRVCAPLRQALAGANIVHSMAMSSLLPLSVLDVLGDVDAYWVHTEHWSGLTNPGTLSPALQAGRVIIERLEHRPDVVTAVCDYLARPLTALRHAAPTVVVPCIVEPAREVFPFLNHGDRIAMITVGGLIPRKNPLMCLETLTSLLALGKDATMTFVGDGPQRQAIEEFCQRNPHVRHRVTITGTVNHSEVSTYLAQADVFIGPTQGDNFFVSAAEAITMGRPVVVSDAGGQCEYVTHNNGRILPRDAHAQQWARAVIDCVDTLRDTESNSHQCIAHTLGDRFSSASVGKQYRALYEQQCSSSDHCLEH